MPTNPPGQEKPRTWVLDPYAGIIVDMSEAPDDHPDFRVPVVEAAELEKALDILGELLRLKHLKSTDPDAYEAQRQAKDRAWTAADTFLHHHNRGGE